MSGSPSLFRGYDTRTYNLVANIAQALPSAREFMIISATIDITALNFSMGDDNGDQEIWPFGVIIGIKEGSVKARIGSSVNQTVVIAMLDGDVTIKDNRFAPGAGSLAVTEADGANAALGQKADASATTDGGTFSLISLFKRMLGKMGPVTATDGAIVSIGATNDAVASSDAGTFSLISLIKRFLATRNEPLFYNAAGTVSQVAGSPLATAAIISAGANTNGVVVYLAVASCLADPTAVAEIVTSGAQPIIQARDSMNMLLPLSITIPSGTGLSYNITGGGRITWLIKTL